MVSQGSPAAKAATIAPKRKENEKIDDDLSEEDKQLQDELSVCVQRLEESNKQLYKPALEAMRTLIRSSTTSMTSVPKPLKFMRPHYSKMKDIYSKLTEFDVRKLCADIISVLGMTMSDQPEHKYDTLNYRLLGVHEEIGAWGHEYVRHLTGQIVSLWNEKDFSDSEDNLEAVSEESKDQKIQCKALVQQIIPYLMEHNAEAEAIDLCIEIEQLDLLLLYTTKLNYQRVCLYMTSCVPYLADPDNYKVLRCAADLYKNFADLGNSMRCALRLNNVDLILSLFNESGKLSDNKLAYGVNTQRQLAYLLGKQQFVLPYDNVVADDDQDLADMLGNVRLSEHFLALGRELDIMDPKLPEDIYKSHLEPARPTLNATTLDSARSNLAASYVNGLVNCGFGKERLIQEDPKEVPWLCKQKEIGKMSTIATLGWVMLWDVDNGLSQIDKYLYVDDQNTRAGALLGCGVVNSGVKHECDPALALLNAYVESETDVLSRASIIGLGIAYAGSLKPEALSCLTPVILDTNSSRLQHSCLAALSAGLIAVGSLNDEVTSTIIQTMLERPSTQWGNPFAKFMALGLALTCFGRQEEVDVILASLEAVSEPLKSMAHMMCDFCAYAGTGNVLKIQHLLHILSERYEEKKKDDSKSNTAVTNSSGGDSNKQIPKGGREKERSGKDWRRGGPSGRGRGRRTHAAGRTSSGSTERGSGATTRSQTQAQQRQALETSTEVPAKSIELSADSATPASEPMETDTHDDSISISADIPKKPSDDSSLSATNLKVSTTNTDPSHTIAPIASALDSTEIGSKKKSSKRKKTALVTIAASSEPESNEVKVSENEDETRANKDTNQRSSSQFDFHAHQGLATLGVAVIAMGEEIGIDMVFRMFGHLLRFGETPIKRAVPLALAICYVSNPQLNVLDTLSKFSHDADPELSYNSILAMGIVGAGTNNARLAAMLRQLALYHSRDPYNLFLVRLAQGLTHLGKGTLTLSPWHSDRFLLRPVAVAGLLTLLVSCIDMRMTFMGRHDYLIFYLTPAIQPRLLMTFDEQLKPLPVTVRVGQAVDVVGQAGRPKTITGFQTHTTPVLLSHGERAELASDEYLPATNLPLEGFIILKKNPDFEEAKV